MADAAERAETYCMKRTMHHSGTPSLLSADPLERESEYAHAEWFDPAMKQAVAQEERRSSQHAGKTIQRPRRVTRTMSA